VSGDVLREAARLMRERAEGATPGPWVVHDGTQWEASVRALSTGMTPGWRRIAQVNRLNPDAEHIASWQPAVALAVADWLDGVAEFVEKASYLPADAPLYAVEEALVLNVPAGLECLAVARAYLTEPS